MSWRWMCVLPLLYSMPLHFAELVLVHVLFLFDAEASEGGWQTGALEGWACEVLEEGISTLELHICCSWLQVKCNCAIQVSLKTPRETLGLPDDQQNYSYRDAMIAALCWIYHWQTVDDDLWIFLQSTMVMLLDLTLIGNAQSTLQYGSMQSINRFPFTMPGF